MREVRVFDYYFEGALVDFAQILKRVHEVLIVADMFATKWIFIFSSVLLVRVPCKILESFLCVR